MDQSKVEIEAAIPFKNEFMPLANVLYLILPYFLELKGIKYDESRVKKVFLTLFSDSLSQLPKSIKNKEEAEHLSSLPTHKQYLKYLSKFMLRLKNDQFVKSFKVVEKKVFNSFFDVYTVVDSGTFEESLEFILSKVVMLDDKSLRLVVKSIKYIHADPVKSYEAHNSLLEDLNLKIFKSKNLPSNKEIEKLRVKDPEAYKELKNQRDIVKEKSWTIINDIWQNEIEEEFITSEEATELCKKAGITLFPPEFKGFIRQNPVKGTDLEFYSVNKERLDKPLSPNGTKLEMWDPKKHKSKGIFNCYFYLVNEKGENVKQYRYTLDTKANKAEEKFENVGMLGNKIVGMQDRFDAPGDLLSKIRKNVFVRDLEFGNTRDKLCALICIIGDMTCARLGTSQGKGRAAKVKAVGIHTCTSNSIVLKGSQLTISYSGKKGIEQSHTIPPNHKTVYSDLKDSTKRKTVVEMVIEELLRRKKINRNGYLFPGLTAEADTISENTVNDYLKENGWPGTYHLFRTYFGCKTFYREMKKLKGTFSQDEAEEEFNRIVSIVSDHLGNSPGAAIGSYIDKELVKEFFEMTKTNVPSDVLNTIKQNQGELITKEFAVKEKKVPGIIKDKKKKLPGIIKSGKLEVGDRVIMLYQGEDEPGVIDEIFEEKGVLWCKITLDIDKYIQVKYDSKWLKREYD